MCLTYGALVIEGYSVMMGDTSQFGLGITHLRLAADSLSKSHDLALARQAIADHSCGVLRSNAIVGHS